MHLKFIIAKDVDNPRCDKYIHLHSFGYELISMKPRENTQSYQAIGLHMSMEEAARLWSKKAFLTYASTARCNCKCADSIGIINHTECEEIPYQVLYSCLLYQMKGNDEQTQAKYKLITDDLSLNYLSDEYKTFIQPALINKFKKEYGGNDSS